MKTFLILILSICVCYISPAQTVLQQMKHNFDSGMNVLKQSLHPQKAKSNQQSTVQPNQNSTVTPVQQQTNQVKETPEINKNNEAKIYHTIPNPDGYNGFVNSIISEYNNKLYVEFKTNGGVSYISEFDENKLNVIPFPTTVSVNNPGYSGSPVICNNNLYFKYTYSTNGVVGIAKFDGKGIQLIPNPDKGLGCIGKLISFNNKLYFRYTKEGEYIQTGTVPGHFAVCDGNTIAFIQDTEDCGFVSDEDFPLIFNNKLYVKCNYKLKAESNNDVVAAPVSQLHYGKVSIGEVTGNKITPISTETSLGPYFTAHVVFNNKLYLGSYTSLCSYDGKEIKLYPTEGEISKFDTFYNGKLYGQSKNNLFEFDGTKVSIIQSPQVRGDKLYYDHFLGIFDNKLFLSYSHYDDTYRIVDSNYIVAFDGKSFYIYPQPPGFDKHDDMGASADYAFTSGDKLFFHYNSGKVILFDNDKVSIVSSLKGLAGDQSPFIFNGKLFFADDNLNYLQVEDLNNLNETSTAGLNMQGSEITQTINSPAPAQNKDGPAPVIGIDSLIHYLSDAAAYTASNNGAPVGKYEVQFSLDVDEDGTLSGVQPLKDAGYGSAASLTYLLKKTSPWMPAKKNGKSVAIKGFIITVPFEVKEQ